MPAFDFTFEELPIEVGAEAVELVNGGCDVAFWSLEEDFYISDIYVIDIGRVSKRLYLRSSDARYKRICDAIVERHRDEIEERIAYEMAEAV